MATTRTWGLLLAVFLAVGGALYGNALSNPFQFDDRHGIVENHHLRDLGNIPKFFSYPEGKHLFAPSEPQAVHYRPLLLTSYTLNFQIGNGWLPGFHLYNLLLHVIACLFLALVAARLGLPFYWAAATGLLCLIHPLQSESINYITGRSSLQSGVLTLTALYCFIRARQGKGYDRYGWLLLTGFATLAALLTKEVAVTIPLILLGYDLLFPPSRRHRWGVHGWGLDIGLAAAGLLFLILQGHAAYFWSILTGSHHSVRSFGDNLWLQAQVLLEYIRLTLLPYGLSMVHDFPGADRASAASIGAAGLLISLAIAALRYRRSIPLLGLGGILFIGVLLPTTLLPMNTPLQESRGYAAVAGIMLALMALLYAAHCRFRWPASAAWAALPVVLLLAFATVQRNAVWASPMSLWADAMAKSPDDFRAHANLGTAHHAAGHYAIAAEHYQAALRLDNREAGVYADLGGALLEMRQMAAAGEAISQAIRVDPDYAPAHFNLGMWRERNGDVTGAIDAYHRAVELIPSYTDARINLGILLARGGDLDGAAQQMEQALSVAPRAAQAYHNLVVVYAMQKRPDAASALYRMAQQNHMVTDRLRRAVGQITRPPPAP